MIRFIAIHLPQFHPFPENDTWWGKGFTEWTNVVRARPLFKDHYQPHLPADLGFYDLRLEEARVAQAAMAKAHGIDGFCYYHYWFNGKRLLNRPLDDMLATKTPDFPFMLCWANENWTRRWDGADREILIKQDYSEQDDRNHIRFLLEKFFTDSRYIKIDGKPFFLVYRPQLFPDIKKTIQIWRDEARIAGFEDLYIGYMQSFGFKFKPSDYNFDCGVDFQPDFKAATDIRIQDGVWNKLLRKVGLRRSISTENIIVNYANYFEKVAKKKKHEPGIFPGIMPMWDNTSRRKTAATVFKDSTPQTYKKWLEHILREYKVASGENKFVFINAWNEWAEGNHLEPCQKWGMQYLQATKEVIEND